MTAPMHTRACSATRGAVTIERLSIQFGERLALAGIDLDVAPGEFVCLLGPSGCGKSTILNAIAGFVAPSEGRISVDGAEVRGPGADRGMVFQQYSLFPWKTVTENVAFGPRMQGLPAKQAREKAREYIEFAGLNGFGDSYPGALSGGMQQRVGIARALVTKPSVLLMDEPFGALDAQTRSLMQELLLRIWTEEGNTIVFVTHDVDEALFLADRIVVLSAVPGIVLLDFAPDLPRPRPEDVYALPAFADAKRQCLKLIRRESVRAFSTYSGAGA